jgi:hypothetical protein
MVAALQCTLFDGIYLESDRSTKTAGSLSRGSSAADILGTIIMTSAHAQYLKGTS